jgi:membrane protease YdiL (CAAX protease family)
MDILKEKDNEMHSFWNNQLSIIIQIIIVLVPSLIFLESGNLLLLGVFLGVCFSWVFLRFRKLNWASVGFVKPLNSGKLIITVIVSSVLILILSYFLRQLVTLITNESPNLDAFNAVRGNPKALFLGLLVAWIFGAFCEELLFRGFLLNSFYKLLPEKYLNNILKWTISLFITSILVGIGHSYQGITGMILTAIIGFFFGLVYLLSQRNLWASILTHGLYDSVAFIMLFYGINLDQIFK